MQKRCETPLIIHVVKPGESLYSISRLYNASFNKIASDNQLISPNKLVIGQALVIIGGAIKHTVAPGQSFYAIAVSYGLTISELAAANPKLTNLSQVQSGQILNIPSTTRKLGTIEVNGYAFANINMSVLRSTLPYLTYLSIFSHAVNADGTLSAINDAPLIAAARKAKVAPLLVITNLLPNAGFSSELAHTILSSEKLQDTLLNNVLITMRAKNYYGLDIDFEYVFPADRQLYNNFLRKAVLKLKSLGYTITTSLAPKTSANQKGLLYEAHDFPVHGLLTTHVVLMTYEWGYTMGPPMAVAPLNLVRKVLEYAVTAIPRKKILMGIPNYGYDWKLPYVKGTKATAISNVSAVDIASKWGARIQYDPVAQSPFFNYHDSSKKEHVVWFEDARSIKAKLKLVDELALGGVSYWTIQKFFSQNWLVLNSLYNIKKVLL